MPLRWFADAHPGAAILRGRLCAGRPLLHDLSTLGKLNCKISYGPADNRLTVSPWPHQQRAAQAVVCGSYTATLPNG